MSTGGYFGEIFFLCEAVGVLIISLCTFWY
jgi:hypothetical protein